MSDFVGLAGVLLKYFVGWYMCKGEKRRLLRSQQIRQVVREQQVLFESVVALKRVVREAREKIEKNEDG